MIFNEDKLQEEIIKTWGEFGVHNEVFTAMRKQISDLKQLTLTDVGSSFSIGFAQYIAKEHYTLVNQIGKIHYWRNEEFSKTTEQLLKDYKETLT